MTAPPDDPDFDASLMKFAQSHPKAIELSSSPTAIHVRGVYAIPKDNAKMNVSHGLLHGPELLRASPYSIIDNAQKTVFAAFSLGKDLSGYPGITHGGIMAMMLDEVMGKTGQSVLGDATAYTAKLDMEYLAPLLVDGFAVIIANVEEVEDRKVWIKAVVEGGKPGVICARARMLVVMLRDPKL